MNEWETEYGTKEEVALRILNRDSNQAWRKWGAWLFAFFNGEELLMLTVAAFQPGRVPLGRRPVDRPPPLNGQ